PAPAPAPRSKHRWKRRAQRFGPIPSWDHLVAPFVVARKPARAPQALELAHDLAPVVAAYRGHQLAEELRPVGKRRLERAEAPPVEFRRLWNSMLQNSLSKGQCEIKTRLRPGGGAAE